MTIEANHPLSASIKSGTILVLGSSLISGIEGVNDLYCPIVNIELFDASNKIVSFDDSAHPIKVSFGFYKTKTIKEG